MQENPEIALERLYKQYLARNPEDQYVRMHSESAFLSGTVRFFRFYEPYLVGRTSILDWGCHHAPDACLIRSKFGQEVGLHGCDIVDPHQYGDFYRYAGLNHTQLTHPFQLPYPDAQFDAVIASGVLEHVPADYESLKELYRVLKPQGRLIVGYLPNAWSLEEWWMRVSGRKDFHRNLYSRGEFRRLLRRSGFLPIVVGYQTQIDLLPVDGGAVAAIRPLLRLGSLGRFTSCLCAVTEKTLYF
jgi:SAM-dependent methyltransferase